MARASGVGLRTKRRLQGVAFLAIIVVLLGLTIVIYDKKLPWQASDHVTLYAHRIGNQLIVPSDVKYEGVLVGRVSSVHSNGTEATLDLEISKAQASRVPCNVVARILPKTLFGEKYVDLINPVGKTLSTMNIGDSQCPPIQEDDSHVSVELQDVFSKLIPVLRAVKPQYLSVALSNTAQALKGRGNELGQNLVLINRYFSVLNKDLPNIQHDISSLADLASNYADAAPNLLKILKNFSVTASTFTVKQDEYARFLAGTAGFATTATKVFGDNSAGLIQLAKSSVGPLGVVAKYSIVLECLPRGLTIFDRQRLEHAFQGGELHIDLIPVNDRGAYTKADKPKLSEFTNAVLPPNCYGLPYGNHKLHPENSKYPFAPGGNYSKGGFTGGSAPSSKPALPGSTEGAGSPSEQSTIASILGQIAGGQSNGLNDLLLGPILRGSEVVTK